MMVKALVNGKEEMVKVVKSYMSGFCNETKMYDGWMDFNGQQIAVTVEESMVVEVVTPKKGTSFKWEYQGDNEQRGADAEPNRIVWITATAKGEGEAEEAFEWLQNALYEAGLRLEWSGCPMDENYGDKSVYGESFTVENQREADRIKKVYMKIKGQK